MTQQFVRLTWSWRSVFPLNESAVHCWPLDASRQNPLPYMKDNKTSCPGIDMQWIEKPSKLKMHEYYTFTFRLVIHKEFWQWALRNGIMNETGNYFQTAEEAKIWCATKKCTETTIIPSHCCFWHMYLHSCPKIELLKEESHLRFCSPWTDILGAPYHSHQVQQVGIGGQGFTTNGTWTTAMDVHQAGSIDIIAHIKFAGMHMVLFSLFDVIPKSVCNNGICDEDEESCATCPVDCGKCPASVLEATIFFSSVGLVALIIIGIIGYSYWKYHKLLWDESWIIKHKQIIFDNKVISGQSIINIEKSSTSVGFIPLASGGGITTPQIFCDLCVYDGKVCAYKRIPKDFHFKLNTQIRKEVRTVRKLEHTNVVKFVGACVEVPNVAILTEYCNKGSLTDVLMNSHMPLTWSFRFHFASDICRGMSYLHRKLVYHGHLKSSNCVIDDRWTVKIADYGLVILCQKYGMTSEASILHHKKYDNVYIAPDRYVNSELNDKSSVKLLPPNAASDVYPFGIILVELATIGGLSDEIVRDYLTPSWNPPIPIFTEKLNESKKKIKDAKENTKYSKETLADSEGEWPNPQKFNELISSCLESTPQRRPSFDGIRREIRKMNPENDNPIDLMISMLEKYSKHLESLVAARTVELQSEKEKTDQLLHSMLPKGVADQLRRGIQIEPEWYSECTIYFSDIVGFTNISGQSTPHQVVTFLNKLYTIFDEIIESYNVYKVETIGDAYMVVSGIPERNRKHASDIAGMSIDIVRKCKTFKIPHVPEESLKIRVGLHSGAACAGVVGLKMPRYCLFGDTVNTASRMESTGEAYRIHISQSTYNHLIKTDQFILEERGVLQIKGKGQMRTYWIVGRKDDADN